MKKNEKKWIIICIAVIGVGIVIGVIFWVIQPERETGQDMAVRTDTKPIADRFENLGQIDACYWQADIIGEENSEWIPGPTGYWMKGFIPLDKERIDALIEEYHMEETQADMELTFVPEEYDMATAKWFYSDAFNAYVKPPGFFGSFYIDRANGMIYFEVCK